MRSALEQRELGRSRRRNRQRRLSRSANGSDRTGPSRRRPRARRLCPPAQSRRLKRPQRRHSSGAGQMATPGGGLSPRRRQPALPTHPCRALGSARGVRGRWTGPRRCLSSLAPRTASGLSRPPAFPTASSSRNQCDAGSLIRRRVFEAGIEFATEMNGFEDWEFFLHAALAGFRGRNALRSGFRYRRRPDSQLASAWLRSEELEAALRRLHPDAYRARALTLREHAEAPRFALVRPDRDDVLLGAACDLEPRALELEAFSALIRATAGGQWPAGDQQLPDHRVRPTARRFAGWKLGACSGRAASHAGRVEAPPMRRGTDHGRRRGSPCSQRWRSHRRALAA